MSLTIQIMSMFQFITQRLAHAQSWKRRLYRRKQKQTISSSLLVFILIARAIYPHGDILVGTVSVRSFVIRRERLEEAGRTYLHGHFDVLLRVHVHNIEETAGSDAHAHIVHCEVARWDPAKAAKLSNQTRIMQIKFRNRFARSFWYWLSRKWVW